jgi:hypothetical protein
LASSRVKWLLIMCILALCIYSPKKIWYTNHTMSTHGSEDPAISPWNSIRANFSSSNLKKLKH